MYIAQRLSQSQTIPIRTLNYHVRTWGAETLDDSQALAPMVLLHGWMDVGASYQFVVDAFSDAFFRGRRIIAPDWRGFGLTMPPSPCDSYAMADYLGDLDQLLDHFAPGRAVDLVGHSMGGNLSMMYAGIRPQRIRTLINLEGFGMPKSEATQAPARYARWMDELRKLENGEMALKGYASIDGVVDRLRKTNPRLGEDKARWLAQHWSARDAASGQWKILGDAAHKVVNPMIYRVDEMLALYASITAPVLAVEADSDSIAKWNQGQYSLAEYHERLKSIPKAEVAVVHDAGHMLHHDQPTVVAGMIENFVGLKPVEASSAPGASH